MYAIKQGPPGAYRTQPPPPALGTPGGYPPSQHPYSIPTMTLMHRERNHEGFLVMEEPRPTTTQVDGRIWSLEVGQQPVRARMCGFGDKDRRPITPPPCVQLVVRDVATGKEIQASDIDISFFVITVDLWDEEAQKEVNLVKHAANSPSISTATAVAFPHTQSGAQPPQQSQSYYPPYQNNYSSPSMAQQSSPGGYYQNQQQQSYGAHTPTYGQYGQTHYGYNHSGFGPNSQQPNGQYPHTTQHLPPSHPSYLLSHQQQALATPHQPTGMFTRNLIGALSASAFRLNNQNDMSGVWFILQDLSIRTDGIFRLKFNFVNVGVPKNDKSGLPTSPMTPTSSSSHTPSTSTLNTSSAPVLASVFSKPFQVFSAKKFPGVIESTELSKTFAQQGIKIPIRKDGDGASGGKKRRNAEEEEDDGDDDQ